MLKSRFDAAISRTSTCIVFSLPTGTLSPSRSTRSRLAWTAADRSATSSMNSVPPWAASNRPRWALVAPQFQLTIGDALRGGDVLAGIVHADGAVLYLWGKWDEKQLKDVDRAAREPLDRFETPDHPACLASFASNSSRVSLAMK